jgi:tight adherence protein C
VSPTLALVLLLATTGLAFVVAAVRIRRHDPVRALVAEFEGDASEVLDDYHRQLETPLVTRALGSLAGRLEAVAGRLLPGNALGAARRQLAAAGLTSQVTVEEYLAVRVLSALGGTAFGVVLGTTVGGARGIALAATVTGMGLLAPRVFVASARRQRLETITRELPDALDLLAISVEAGLGFEQALAVVSDRSRTVLAQEFGHTLKEMQLGRSRVDALRELQRRVDHTDLDSLVLSLVQADALGMPLTRILRTQATEMRRRRRQRVREAAAKLPVKMLFPMVFFIFPALFVVVLGPAVLGIMRSL